MQNNQTDTTRLSEVYNVLSQKLISENSLFWSRFSALTMMNLALLAFSGALLPKLPKLQIIIIDLFGITLSIVLIVVNVLGRKWLGYWEDKIHSVEVNLPEPHLFPGNWDAKGRRQEHDAPGSMTFLALSSSIMVLLLWIAKIVISIKTNFPIT